VVFTVYDLDLTTTIESTSDIVDNIVIYPDIPAVSSANDPFSDPMLFTGNGSYSHLKLAFRLTCGPDSYGPDCTFCVPTNDSTGHHNCNNVTGEKECLDGYQGSECNGCVPAEKCSPEGGYCEEPGDCVCYPGFSGDDCSELVCSDQICNNSSCKREHNFLYYTCGQECVVSSLIIILIPANVDVPVY
jgi:hypothetical protein